MKTILVTGGAGFIGSNFIRYLQRVEPELFVVNLDALTYAGRLENLNGITDPKRYEFIKGDICDQELVRTLLRKYSISRLVNFAAETHVDRSIQSPAKFIQTNIVGTFSLLEAARSVWIEENQAGSMNYRFHHISTDEVFGSLLPDEPAFSEKTPYSPSSPYSASKAGSDHLVRAFFHTYGLPVTITNCSNNYGPHQFPEKLFPLMILNALQGKPLPVYGDGKQIRDWLFVEDHCEAIWRVITSGQVGSTYAIGGNNQPTNLEIVSQICAYLDEVLPKSDNISHSNLIQFVKDRPGHDRRYAVDISKIQHELGWYPRHSLKEGIKLTIDWYLNHSEWLTAITGQVFQNWLKVNYQKR